MFKLCIEGPSDANNNGKPDLHITISAFGFVLLDTAIDADPSDVFKAVGDLIGDTRVGNIGKFFSR